MARLLKVQSSCALIFKYNVLADPDGRGSVVGLRSLAYWDCSFESRRGHGCLFLVSVVCCQVEVSATDRSLALRGPAECSVSQCD